ncbi:hypothetical protein JTB14_025835 [Gonioctena quinquepunctata]|nr:hypothetical protein JTB14_025835 [Gonioctena quinquepunctata]
METRSAKRRLENRITKQDTLMRYAVSPIEMVAVTLRKNASLCSNICKSWADTGKNFPRVIDENEIENDDHDDKADNNNEDSDGDTMRRENGNDDNNN